MDVKHLIVNVFAVALAGACCTSAAAQVSGGHFISLDGAMEHQFLATGDYVGRVHGKSGVDVVGVFREGPGVCWFNFTNGGKKSGDAIIYVGEVQCCLGVQTISDKTAMTMVWVEGTGPGYQVCKNQVFSRQ